MAGTPRQTDLFVVDGKGQLNVAWVVGAGTWNGPAPIGPAGLAPARAYVAASQQYGVVLPPGYVPAVIAGDQATFDSGILTSGLPLRGSVHLVIDAKGDFTFTCYAHDSGFDNIDYVIIAVMAVPSGLAAFTMQHLGGVEGTAAGLPFGTPRRDDSFTTAGNQAQIANLWSEISGALMTASIDGQDALAGGIEGALGSLLKGVLEQLGKTAAQAVIALV